MSVTSRKNQVTLPVEFAGIFDETVYLDGHLDQLRREWL